MFCILSGAIIGLTGLRVGQKVGWVGAPGQAEEELQRKLQDATSQRRMYAEQRDRLVIQRSSLLRRQTQLKQLQPMLQLSAAEPHLNSWLLDAGAYNEEVRQYNLMIDTVFPNGEGVSLVDKTDYRWSLGTFYFSPLPKLEPIDTSAILEKGDGIAPKRPNGEQGLPKPLGGKKLGALDTTVQDTTPVEM